MDCGALREYRDDPFRGGAERVVMRLLQGRRRGTGRWCPDAEITVSSGGFLHDLGQELATLSALVEMVRDAEIDDVTRARIGLIEQEAERLCELVRDKVAKGSNSGVGHGSDSLALPGPGVDRETAAGPGVATIALVIGDDHTLFGEALAGVLTVHSFLVRAVTRSISGVIEAVRRHRPDVCLLDRYFVDGDVIDAIDEIIAAGCGTRVLILTADNDMDGVTHALRSGAQGYVHKSSGFGVLAEAIARVVDDEGVVVEVPIRRGRRLSPELAEARRLAAALTARERDCLELIVEGLGTEAMARRLGVSNTTVRTHSQRLLTKLGVHSRLEAASFAVRYSVLDRPVRAGVCSS